MNKETEIALLDKQLAGLNVLSKQADDLWERTRRRALGQDSVLTPEEIDVAKQMNIDLDNLRKFKKEEAR
jgi:hypothetical protein